MIPPEITYRRSLATFLKVAAALVAGEAGAALRRITVVLAAVIAVVSAGGTRRARASAPRLVGEGRCRWGRPWVERVTGIEPAFSAWEADVLPLNYTRARPERSKRTLTVGWS